MSLLPSRGPETSTRQEGEFEVVGVDEDVAPVLDALASDTAREVLNEIYDEPGTPSEIAGRLDMSIQKVAYHLEKLEDVDLIEVAGTRYSEKGQEMSVYEPPDDPLVLFVGTKERKSRLRSLVRRVVPPVGALAIGSLLVQRLFGAGESWLPFGGDSPGDDGGIGGDRYRLTGGGGGSGDAEAAADVSTATQTATDGGRVAETTAAGGTATPEASATASAPTPVESSASTATPGSAPTGTPIESITNADANTSEALRIAAETADPGIEPGLAFFLGGIFAIALVGGWLLYRSRDR